MDASQHPLRPEALPTINPTRRPQPHESRHLGAHACSGVNPGASAPRGPTAAEEDATGPSRGSDDNPCALNVTTSYLVDGEMPRHDVFCRGSTKSGLQLDHAAERVRADALDRLLR